MRENRLWQPGLCLLCGILGWLPALSTRPARAADEPVFSCDELELWVAVVKLATVYRTNVLLYDQSQDAGQMRALPYCARSMNAGPVTIPEAAMSLEAAVRRMQEEVPAYDFMVRPGTVQILWRDVAHHVLCHRVTVSFKDATDHEVIDILNERIAEMGHPPPGGPRLPGMSLLGFTTRIDFPTPYFRFSHEAVNERIIDILQEVTSRGTPERPFMCRVYHRPREAKVYVELEAASGRVYLSYAPPGEVKRALTHGTVTEKRDAVAALGLRRERREPLPFEEVKDALFALMEEEKAGGYRGNVFGQLGVYDTPEVRRKMLEVLRESDDWVDRILALGRIAKSKRPDREAVIAEAALRPDQDDRVVATAIQYLCTPTSSRWREVLAELRERGPLSKRVESVAEFCEQRSLRYEELSDPPGANPPAASSRSAASDPVCSRQVPSEDGGAAGNAARDNVQVEGASGLPWLHLALGLGGAAVAGAVGMWLLLRRRAA